MFCPLCYYPQHCPCDPCKKRLPKGISPWVWYDGEFVACANCGLYLHCDYWLDINVEQGNRINAIAFEINAPQGK